MSTLDSRTLAPVYDSGPHLNNIVLLLTLLDSLDGIPCFEAPGLTKFFTVVRYDGMQLNIGTFFLDKKMVKHFLMESSPK